MGRIARIVAPGMPLHATSCHFMPLRPTLRRDRRGSAGQPAPADVLLGPGLPGVSVSADGMVRPVADADPGLFHDRRSYRAARHRAAGRSIGMPPGKTTYGGRFFGRVPHRHRRAILSYPVSTHPRQRKRRASIPAHGIAAYSVIRGSTDVIVSSFSGECPTA